MPRDARSSTRSRWCIVAAAFSRQSSVSTQQKGLTSPCLSWCLAHSFEVGVPQTAHTRWLVPCTHHRCQATTCRARCLSSFHSQLPLKSKWYAFFFSTTQLFEECCWPLDLDDCVSLVPPAECSSTAPFIDRCERDAYLFLRPAFVWLSRVGNLQRLLVFRVQLSLVIQALQRTKIL